MRTAVPDATSAIGPADVVAAQQRLGSQVHRTALMHSSLLDRATGATVRAKCEHLQRTGSFKIRGALNRLMLLTPDERAAGVVAFSSGNHAQGVALAAQIVGVDATIVMPADAPAVKKDATRAYGATVVEYDRFHEDRELVAARVAGRRGSVIVPPFNDARVIAGQGTVGLEIAQDWPEVQVALIPVGGGGLAAGMAIALRHAIAGIQIVGVEPAAADDARQSLQAGRIVTIDQPDTVADGVATRAVGTLTFPILRSLLDGIVTVTEDEILSALSFVVSRMKQVVEPTGALTTAALLHHRVEGVHGKNVMTLFCGGNLDPSVMAFATTAPSADKYKW